MNNGYKILINEFSKIAGTNNVRCIKSLSSKGKPDILANIILNRSTYDRMINYINETNAFITIVSNERTEIPILRRKLYNKSKNYNLDIPFNIFSLIDFYLTKGEYSCNITIKHWNLIKNIIISLSNSYLSDCPEIKTEDINNFMFIFLDGNRYNYLPENIDFYNEFDKTILQDEFIYNFVYDFNQFKLIRNYKRGFEYWVANRYSAELSPKYKHEVDIVPQEQDQIRKGSKLYAVIHSLNNNKDYIISTKVPIFSLSVIKRINKTYNCDLVNGLEYRTKFILNTVINKLNQTNNTFIFKSFIYKNKSDYKIFNHNSYTKTDITVNAEKLPKNVNNIYNEELNNILGE